MATLSSSSSSPALSTRLHSNHSNHSSRSHISQQSVSQSSSSSASSSNQFAETHKHPPLQSRNTKSWDYVARTMIAGGVAGITAKTIIAPLDRVKILFQASNPRYERYAGTLTGVFKAGRDIQRTFGLRGLFQGNAATILRIFPHAAIRFTAYEQYRNLLMPARRDETPYKKLVAGSMAGVTSIFFTYPLDLIRVRLAYETTPPSYTTLVSNIYHEPTASAARPRISNFYRGFLCSVAGMIPYAGVSFFTYDIMQDYCRHHLSWTLKLPQDQARGLPDRNGDYNKPKLLTVAELACGGIAGAVSMTAAYPFEVVRRKMQVAGAMNSHKVVVDGMWQIARRIYHTAGPKGFFVGLSIGYLKVVPMVALSFTAYEKMKTLLEIN